MNLSRFTKETQEVMIAAQDLTKQRDHRAVEPEHLLSAIMDTTLMSTLIQKMTLNGPENSKAVRW